MPKNLTTAQLEHIRTMALAKGITGDGFQKNGLDSGVFGVALDAVRQGARIRIIPPITITAPPWGRIYILRVPVLKQPWLGAVMEAAPDTLDYRNFWRAADFDQPILDTREAELVLVNFGESGDFPKAIAWASLYGLVRTSLRQHVFSIAKHNPDLCRELGMNPMCVVASEECSFEGNRFVGGVLWSGAKRLFCLHYVPCVGKPTTWVAFRRE